MKKKDLIFTSLTLATLTVGAAFGASMLRDSAVLLNAVECEHSHVEHYAATQKSIEHWACCECHHAWADEERTIEVSSDTTLDRGRIEVNDYFYKANWNDNSCFPRYDETYGFVFTHNLTGQTNMSDYCIETYGPKLEDDTIKDITIYIANKTDKTLVVDLRHRDWSGKNDISLAANESKVLTMLVDDFNAKSSGGNYGYSFLFNRSSEEAINGYFEVSRPIFNHFDADKISQYDDALAKLQKPVDDLTTNEYVEQFMKNYAVSKEAYEYVNGHENVLTNYDKAKTYASGVLLDASTLMSGWSYGTDLISSRESVSIGDVKYNKISVTTGSEFGLAPTTFSLGNPSEVANRFVVRIYNPTSALLSMHIHALSSENDGYVWGDGWDAGGLHKLQPQTWNTVVFDSAKFNVKTATFALVINGGDVSGDWMFSSAVPYIYNSKIVHGDNGQNLTTNVDWAAVPTGVCDNRTVFKAPVDSAAVLALENTVVNLDANVYDHVEFYVYNDAAVNVYFSTRGEGSSNVYQLGNAILNEWTKFELTIEQWNDIGSTPTRYLNISGDGRTGYLYVSYCVAVAK